MLSSERKFSQTNDVTQFLKSLNTCKPTVSFHFVLGLAGLKCIFDQDQEAFSLPALGSNKDVVTRLELWNDKTERL